MAERSSFFTSLNGDRKYKASDFAEYFKSFIGNGVFPNPATNLQIVALGEDMNIIMKAGKSWTEGYMYENTDNFTLTLSASDSALDRIDRIVIRCDFINREIKACIKEGAFAQDPVAPSLQRDADLYEIGIAEIEVKKGVIAIKQSNVKDTRLDNNLCGIVTQTVETIDTSELFRQIEAFIKEKIIEINAWINNTKIDFETIVEDKSNEFIDWVDVKSEGFQSWLDTSINNWELDFKTWFETIKGILNEDVAGNLTLRILELESKMNNLKLVSDNVTRPNSDKTVEESLSQVETSILNLETELGTNKDTLQANINSIREVL